MGVVRSLFGKYLLVTNTVSCGLMMGTGDIIQQRTEQFKRQYYPKYVAPRTVSVKAASPHNELGKDFIYLAKTVYQENREYKHDYVRTQNMMVVGFLQGPFHHWFYGVLERFFPGRSVKCVLKKTFFDQLIASPTCLAIFFIGLGLLEYRNVQEIVNEVRLKLIDTWKVDCCFWPPTQCVNFLFIPLQYRVLYTNFMTMLYDIFLSYMKYDAHFE